ncbi:MAG: NnrS family protein [Myxococcota bacterium]
MPSDAVPTGSLGVGRPAERGLPPLVAIGFRPFFLLAALLAAGLLPIYVVHLMGKLSLDTPFDAVGWHAHEMLFGFVGAVFAGFFFTAVQNWTKRKTVRGAPLVGMILLWIAGRVAMISGGGWPTWVVVALDVSFLPLVALIILRPLVAARSRRNMGFPALLLAMSAGNLLMHLASHGVLSYAWFTPGQRLALDCVVAVLVIFGGRVLPLFTRNAIRPATVRATSTLDRAGMWATVAFVVLDPSPFTRPAGAAVAILAGVLNLARMKGWGTRHTLRKPIVWVLHAGWAFTSLGLLLTGLAALTPQPPSTIATHVLTVGAIGVLTLGMMSRVSLGHTGRPLKAHKAIVAAYVLMLGALLVRAVVPWVAPGAWLPAMHASSSLWSLAFVLFLIVYTPILSGPRADGRPD